MAEERKYNFSAGPAVLPVDVLKKAQEELLCLPGCGASILEISHRSKQFGEILAQTKANVRELLGVPENYQILFLQGGALTQFAMIPMNIIRNTEKSADYILTGNWSKKAASEAKTQGKVNIIWDNKEEGYVRKPTDAELTTTPGAAYCYICANETIEGIQYPREPQVDLPLVCDASSEIFSRPVDIEKYGILYACAQKNAGPAGVTLVIMRDDFVAMSGDDLPSMFSYKKLAEKDSMLNTPPTFGIYMMKLVTDWLKEQGGLQAMYEKNVEKAKLLYDVIDASNGFYRVHGQKEYRSFMNVSFRLPSEELDKKFQEEAKAYNLINLNGHRSVGGERASIYNAMPREGVVTLRDFMVDFAKKNA
ncbi:MAG: 3-phosphoserine/phosphohydroxythreonine transaminase [Thermoguttaceae bacterium]|nr:3-phosphoserine/phosphohydroxythreonine transaminase [Thermoguttaceae bacterium]